MGYKEVDGNLIAMALNGEFDVIAHGCNCHCVMGAGIAPQMAHAFGADTFPMEHDDFCGDINKLGTIDFQRVLISTEKEAWPVETRKILEGFGQFKSELIVVNAYTQYGFGSNHKEGSPAPVDYEAITLAMRKMNKTFEGLRIGLPLIGCGLAGGDWTIVQKIFKEELKDCEVTVVHFITKVKPKFKIEADELNF